MLARVFLGMLAALCAASPVRADDLTAAMMSAFVKVCAATPKPDSFEAVDALARKAGFGKALVSDPASEGTAGPFQAVWLDAHGEKNGVSIHVFVWDTRTKREFRCAANVFVAGSDPGTLAAGLKDFLALGPPKTVTPDEAKPSEIEVHWPLIDEPPGSECYLYYDKSQPHQLAGLVYVRAALKP